MLDEDIGLVPYVFFLWIMTDIERFSCCICMGKYCFMSICCCFWSKLSKILSSIKSSKCCSTLLTLCLYFVEAVGSSMFALFVLVRKGYIIGCIGGIG